MKNLSNIAPRGSWGRPREVARAAVTRFLSPLKKEFKGETDVGQCRELKAKVDT